MRKTLLLSALLIGLISLKPQKAGAVVTGITGYGTDTMMTYCVLPTTDYFAIWGSLTGSVPSTGDSIDIYLNFDDGFDTTFRIRDYSYGGSSGGYYSITIPHTYVSAGTYTPYFTATSVSAGLSTSYTDFGFTLTGLCGTVTGTLYVDVNSNCVHDLGEPYLVWAPVLVVNTSTSDTMFGGWTDDSGFYSMELPDATYIIIAAPEIHSWWWYWTSYADSSLTATCPASGTATVTVTGTSTYTDNFAFTCTPLTSFDVQASGYNWCFVPGDSNYVEVWVGDWYWYWDYTCTSLSSTITLTLDSRLSYAGSVWGGAPSSVSGSTVTWNYTSTGDFFDFWALIKVVTSSSATLGDTICNTVYATPTSVSDPDLANNTSTFCGVVTSSYDPNGKEVSPQGRGIQGYIPNGQQLTYNIHFQNTGTASARNVVVVDTLSPNLDPKTLHIIKSSAACEVYTSGNLVKFTFNDIHLPDSAASPLGSIGAITYAIMPKPALAALTQIKNKAAIYFDYNAPVWTNSTLNTIEGPTGITPIVANFKASIYPNPANTEVYAQTEDKTDFNLNITDMLGRTVATARSFKGNASVNTQTFVSGIYLVKLVNANGTEVTSKLTIQH